MNTGVLHMQLNYHSMLNVTGIEKQAGIIVP